MWSENKAAGTKWTTNTTFRTREETKEILTGHSRHPQIKFNMITYRADQINVTFYYNRRSIQATVQTKQDKWLNKEEKDRISTAQKRKQPLTSETVSEQQFGLMFRHVMVNIAHFDKM